MNCSSTKPGQELLLVGADEVLGAWNPAKAVKLTTTEASFPMWSCELPQPPAMSSEFKFVISHGCGGFIWEPGSANRKWPYDGSEHGVYFARWGAD